MRSMSEGFPVRKLTFPLLFLLAALLFAPQSHAADRLRVASEGAYPPFNSLNEKGELVGFDIEIARAVCLVMGVSCEIVAEPWATILDGLRDKRYDVIVASMVRTPEREKIADFTDSYYRSRSIFIGKKELAQPKEGDPLVGKRVGTAKGTVQAEYLLKNYADKYTVVVYDDTSIQQEKLASGDVDAILDGTLTGYAFLQTDKGRNFDFVGNPIPLEDDNSDAARIAVRKGETALRDDINRALQTIRLDGTYDRINRKYFPFSIY